LIANPFFAPTMESGSRFLLKVGFGPRREENAVQIILISLREKLFEGPNSNFQVYDPLDFLAAVTAHIPDRREHLVRYYGWYSIVQRGKRRKQGLEAKPPEAPPIENYTIKARAARRAWARLIKKIYKVDPLLCPECGGDMKIIVFIDGK
jgi:hypothetical protein